jgi:hypothetical protein
MSSLFENAEFISVYTVDDGIRDGMLVKVLEHRWPELSGGKPIVMTASIQQAFSLAAVMELWNEMVERRRAGRLRKGDIFLGMMNMETVWIIEDESAFTVMFPEDY